MDTSDSYKIAFDNINKFKPDFSKNDNYLVYHMKILNPTDSDYNIYLNFYNMLKKQYIRLSDAKKNAIMMAWTIDKIKNDEIYMCSLYDYYRDNDDDMDKLSSDIREIIADAAIRDYLLSQEYHNMVATELKNLLAS